MTAARLFAEVLKDATSTSVHAQTAIGNEGTKRRARLFSTVVAEKPRAVETEKRNTERRLVRHDETTAKVPFPYDASALAELRPDQMPRFLGALTDPDRLEMREIPLASLTAIQNRVDPAKVEAMRAGMPGKPAIVARVGARHLILDGHHRLVAEWLNGKDTVQVRYKDLTPFSNAMKRDSSWALPMTIAKADPDQRLIFGWASVVEQDGKIVVDKQGDIIPVEELEKAAYEFTLYSREGDDMHMRPRTSRMVESMVFTREKQAALGIDLKKVGWWVGFRVDDGALWDAVKRGERPEFSIGGAANPVEV